MKKRPDGPLRGTGKGWCLRIIEAGTKFTRWTTVEKRTERSVLCRCQCGIERKVYAASLISGKSKGCGRCHKNGVRTVPEFKALKAAIRRCHDSNNKDWANYGGRGIRVCDEWRRSFDAFIAHIGPRPSPDYSLDRIDNDRGYEPGNVRWATWIEQRRNQRRYQSAHIIATHTSGTEEG